MVLAIPPFFRPAMGTLRVADVKFDDCDRLHRRISTRTKHKPSGAPYRANRVASLLHKMFALAIRWKMRPDNPCGGIERNVEQPLERYLKADELDRLLDVLAHWSDYPMVVDVVYLLMETGCRPGELFKATWAQFETPGLWVKPSSNTKDVRVHRVPLSGPAQLRLCRMRESSRSEYLFPSKGGGHIKSIQNSWQRICKQAEIKGRFRLYDVRHSNASFLADDGRDLLTIGAMLGHSQAQTTRRYVHLFDDKLRAAAEGMGARLDRKPAAEVHELPPRAARR
jgi:integrase